LSFYEAITVFDDEYALYMSDENHSDSEDRFMVLGMSEKLNLLMVCHCFRSNDSVIRIISARKATKTETNLYGGRL